MRSSLKCGIVGGKGFVNATYHCPQRVSQGLPEKQPAECV